MHTYEHHIPFDKLVLKGFYYICMADMDILLLLEKVFILRENYTIHAHTRHPLKRWLK